MMLSIQRVLLPGIKRISFLLFLTAVFLLIVNITLFAQKKEQKIIKENNAEYYDENIIIKFKSHASLSKISEVKNKLKAKTEKQLKLIDAELWTFTGMSVKQALNLFKGNPFIEYIEPNYVVSSSDQKIPNDTYYSDLWGMTKIQAPEAWTLTTGNNILIGVIDSGVDYLHPDLAANIWTNPGEIPGNGIDDDNNGYIDDVHGYDWANNDSDPMDDNSHGTHVAGTIAGVGNNNTGIVGVNWSAKIIALKFLRSDGRGSVSNAILALQYSLKMGARITNNSWGGGSYSLALYNAIKSAGLANSLCIAAAGNFNSNNDVEPFYPSAYDLNNIISVAATDINDVKASFSNYGAATVDLGAPGVNIKSTTPFNNYEYFGGTSMAAPHVTGVAALIWSVSSSLSNANVKEIILNSCKPVVSLNGKCVTGGLLNAYNALKSISTSDNNIVLNTEHGALSNGAAFRTQAGSIGTNVAYCTTTSSQISFNINLPEGTWYAWARLFYGSSSTLNSFFISIDDGPKFILGNNDNVFDQWHWDGYRSQKIILGNLSAGNHKVTIWGREPKISVLIDQVLLTKNQNFIPTDQVSQPEKFILFAENGVLANGAALRTQSGSMSTQVAYCTSTSSTISFNVNIPSEDTWYAWARLFYSSTSTQNSFFISVDGGTKHILGNNDNIFDQWHWDGYRSQKITLGNLTAGNHTITIWGREPKISSVIDVLVVTKDPDYIPSGSTPKEPDENIAQTNLPDKFNLSQNYPNPFNPSTTIAYNIPDDGFVSLKIYDAIGNEITTLTNEYRIKGKYEAKFNASGLTSGIYFYRINVNSPAGNYNGTKKLVLMK